MKCPYCGKEEFVTGKQKSKAVYHEICVNCGTIVRSYVKNPENLRKAHN